MVDPAIASTLLSVLLLFLGSALTGNGVTSMIKDELKLYIPYFKTKKTS